MRLFERASELEALDGWLADAQAGSGRLVLLDGEAGVGKTSLLAEFAVRRRVARRPLSARLLWSGCDALSTPRPLGPLLDLAPVLGGRVEQLLCGDLTPPGEVPRDALFGGLLERLREGGDAWVLVVVDLHWSDELTLDLLRFLAGRIARLPVLILCSYRDAEAGPAHPLRLMLGDLANVSTVRRLRRANRPRPDRSETPAFDLTAPERQPST